MHFDLRRLFGAGIGILMLSSLAFMGLSDIHEMNALKSLLGSLINGVSVCVFVASDAVHWPFALAMGVSSIVGGYAAPELPGNSIATWFEGP